MKANLTLSVDKKIIEAAKKYAKMRNISLSGLIENYLINVINISEGSEAEISPLIKSLSGVIKIDMKQDYRKEYSHFLADKYK